MKTTLLLNDETTAARLLLQNAASNKVNSAKDRTVRLQLRSLGSPVSRLR